MNNWKNKKLSKLTIVSPIFPPDIGGPASYVYELGQRLKSDFDITVITFCEGKANLMKGVSIHSIDPSRHGFLGRQLRLLRNLIRFSRDADCIYIQGPVVVGFLSSFFAKNRGIKSMLKFVGDIAWEEASRHGKTDLDLNNWLKIPKKDFKSKILQWVQKKSFKNVDKIIVPSEYLKNLLVKYYEVPESKIEMIYNAFEYRSVDSKKSERAYSLMCAGRLERHKNVDLIIEAMKLLPEKYTLDIYGNGSEKVKLVDIAKELGGRVKFFGNVSHAELSREMEKHEMFILYSSYEGLPHVILEAFAARCPIVASNILGTNEVAIDDENAVLAESENPKRLAEAIRNLSWDKKRRERHCINGVKLLKTEFSWNTHLEKLKKLI